MSRAVSLAEDARDTVMFCATVADQNALWNQPRARGTALGRPDGNMSGLPDRGAKLTDEIALLLDAACGHALVLFTSYAAMSFQ